MRKKKSEGGETREYEGGKGQTLPRKKKNKATKKETSSRMS